MGFIVDRRRAENMKPTPVLFASTEGWVVRGLNGGITTMIVDWERRGKARRQKGFDTEINGDTVEDLERLRDFDVPNRWVRINGFGQWTADEVESAVGAGATRILLPMVTTVGEVEGFLEMLDGRCESGILVETRAAVRCAEDLAELPLEGVYVGLNDLAIDRGLGSIFDSVADGTLDRIREAFPSVEFGFGGMTVLDGGSPVPFPLLLTELARLRCDFSFCRRSFKRDVAGREIAAELRRIDRAFARLLERDEGGIEADRRRFVKCIAEIVT